MGVMVINARFFKPIDTKMLDTVFKENLPVTVFETDCEIGSLSSAILEAMNKKDHQIDIIGIQDHFVPQGSIRVLRQEEGIDIDTVFERLERKNA